MHRRDWTIARSKRDSEPGCRVCGTLPVEAAHIISRSLAPNGGEGWDNIIPLCREHHREYDAHRLDLLPHLTAGEQAQAVRAAGGIITALRVITGRRT